MNRRHRIALFICVISTLFCSIAVAADVKHFPAGGKIQFVLHDDINLPFYSWPRTLLSYPVDFSAAHVHENEIQLFDDGGNPAPMQLSDVRKSPDGTLNFADVCFFSDLKPGQTVAFTLSISGRSTFDPRVSEKVVGSVIDVDGGSIQVRLPQSQSLAAWQSIPAPIIAMNRGGDWIGDNQLISPNRRVKSITTQTLDQGPLFRTYSVRYDFEGGGIYIATVKIVAGYSFVDFSEEMSGLTQSDGAYLDMNWIGFSPTLRYPAGDFDLTGGAKWMGIDEPVITPDLEEDPKWVPGNEIEDPSKDMAFELAAYSGNGVRDATPVASFWDDAAGGSELSVFALDTLKWQDHKYGIWQPSTNLQVHFRHTDGVLHWTWPLITGSRSTGISLTDAQRAQAATDDFVRKYLHIDQIFGGSGQTQDMRQVRLRSAQLLRSWYGTLSLDHVKDMDLTYPDSARQGPAIFASTDTASPDEFSRRLKHSVLTLYPLGMNLVAMDIRHRELYDTFIPGFTRWHTELSDTDRKRAVALMLLSAYLNSSDDLCPVRICLGGCPNMSADGFSVPAEVTFLFPDHPMAGQWRVQFEKTLRLMACFYTRPDVPLWDSLGGRWTESLSVYNWAFLRPTELGEFCSESGDGENRFVNPWLSLRGRWMVDELTAPIFNPAPYWRQPKDPAAPFVPKPAVLDNTWKPGMELSPDLGFERQYAPHGAHGSGTGILVPWQARDMGYLLMRFDPMVAEHLLWAAHQVRSENNGEMSSDRTWARQILASLPENSGTEPHLQSCKYTGHGIILRAGVGTPEELSIHLDQIDAGPNYRWGDNGQGASGTLYFYAQGQVWSGHERENTGDHYDEDTVGATNFGFMKGGKYRDIGANVLDQPMYDLGGAQFAQLQSLRGPGAYSWPQYDSRSILLVGTDYFAILDKSGVQPLPAAGRFSWFQAPDLPFPKLIFLKPLKARVDHWSEVQTQSSKGILRDADGASLVLVTHKGAAVEMRDMTFSALAFLHRGNVREYAWRKGAQPVDGVWPIRAPHSDDLLFLNDQPISCALPTGEIFRGDAGVIRHWDDGATELAIFHGSTIGTKDLQIEVPPADEIGVSAAFQNTDEIQGEYFAPHGASRMTLTFADVSQIGSCNFYVDGQKQSSNLAGASLTISLPAGRHQWQWTSKLPTPLPVNVMRTENFAGGATVYFQPVAGAESYQLQISADGGTTWKPAAEATQSPIRVVGSQRNGKIHVRLIARNSQRSSSPGDAYPIYLTHSPPLPPDGLYLHLSNDRVDAYWGQVLGVSRYKLYRRRRGDEDWQCVFTGLDNSFVDHARGVVPCDEYPGSEYATASTVYEYAIAAVNGNGEGPKSASVSTDPAGWQAWWPADAGERFKRQSAYWLPPYVSQEQVPPAYYPQ